MTLLARDALRRLEHRAPRPRSRPARDALHPRPASVRSRGRGRGRPVRGARWRCWPGRSSPSRCCPPSGSSENRLVRYSVARSSRSANNREALFASQFGLFEQSNLVGIGPAVDKSALGRVDASTAKEAHSDYLASLVERGPLGVIGLLALVRCGRCADDPVSSAPTPTSRDPALYERRRALRRARCVRDRRDHPRGAALPPPVGPARDPGGAVPAHAARTEAVRESDAGRPVTIARGPMAS